MVMIYPWPKAQLHKSTKSEFEGGVAIAKVLNVIPCFSPHQRTGHQQPRLMLLRLSVLNNKHQILISARSEQPARIYGLRHGVDLALVPSQLGLANSTRIHLATRNASANEGHPYSHSLGKSRPTLFNVQTARVQLTWRSCRSKKC